MTDKDDMYYLHQEECCNLGDDDVTCICPCDRCLEHYPES